MHRRVLLAPLAALLLAALPAAPAAAASPVSADLLPANVVPTFGGGNHWVAAGTARTQLRGPCVPLLPRGVTATSVFRLPGAPAPVTRALQTVVQLPTMQATARAQADVARRVAACHSRVFPMRSTAGTMLWSTVTPIPGNADEAVFGYIGIARKGNRMTVVYFSHGGQDSDFPDGVFQRWLARAQAALG
ncbi:hypothetical protein CLV35_1748 [Motilibacter peucedani]|uniref:PknH-like protein n=1 Tax=Motilibacter peucedani TaxID=598650 RepID=A0A420XPV2_9ACTN|nr:hypothetical protein [Motilibacter peucedani]RKS75289.1 hypothetical protein CLV35_1748 [Motilibacter peucedani]